MTLANEDFGLFGKESVDARREWGSVLGPAPISLYPRAMAHWILKSEPDSYSWDDLVRDGQTEWTGVRNHAAAAHLRAMQVGDSGYFYHSGAQRAAVGRVEIVRPAQKDGEEGNWVSVAVKPGLALTTPLTLAAIKAEPRLADMALVRQSRLSVSPVTDADWALLEAMGNG